MHQILNSKYAYYLFVGIVVLVIFFTLILPLTRSVATYNKYEGLKNKGTYVNADIIEAQTKQGFLQNIIMGCYIKVTYRYLDGGKEILGHSDIACKYDEKLVIGNSLPVYFDRNRPLISSSTLEEISGPRDLFANNILWFSTNICLIIMLILWHHYLNQKPLQKLILPKKY